MDSAFHHDPCPCPEKGLIIAMSTKTEKPMMLKTDCRHFRGDVPPYLRQDGFLRAFTHKGRFAEMLSEVPIHIILHPQAGLFGAACHALELAR